jgi:hypothetical protein
VWAKIIMKDDNDYSDEADLIDSYFLPGGIFDPDTKDGNDIHVEKDDSQSRDYIPLPLVTPNYPIFPPTLNSHNPWATTDGLQKVMTSSIHLSELSQSNQSFPKDFFPTLYSLSTPQPILSLEKLSTYAPPFQKDRQSLSMNPPPGFEGTSQLAETLDDESIQSVPRELRTESLHDMQCEAASLASSLSHSTVPEDDEEDGANSEAAVDPRALELLELDTESRNTPDGQTDEDEANLNHPILQQNTETHSPVMEKTKMTKCYPSFDSKESVLEGHADVSSSPSKSRNRHSQLVSLKSDTAIQPDPTMDRLEKPKLRKRRNHKRPKSTITSASRQVGSVSSMSQVDVPIDLVSPESKSVLPPKRPSSKLISPQTASAIPRNTSQTRIATTTKLNRRISHHHQFKFLFLQYLRRGLLILLSSGISLLGAIVGEVWQDPTTLISYLSVRFLPTIVTWQIQIWYLPHWITHILSCCIMAYICRQPPQRRLPHSLDDDGRRRRNSHDNYSNPNERQQARNLLHYVPILYFFWVFLDGFSIEYPILMDQIPSSRMIYVFILLVIRRGLWPSSFVMASISLQILMANCFPYGDLWIVIIGMTSLYYKRQLEQKELGTTTT